MPFVAFQRCNFDAIRIVYLQILKKHGRFSDIFKTFDNKIIYQLLSIFLINYNNVLNYKIKKKIHGTGKNC